MSKDEEGRLEIIKDDWNNEGLLVMTNDDY